MISFVFKTYICKVYIYILRNLNVQIVSVSIVTDDDMGVSKLRLISVSIAPGNPGNVSDFC